MADRKISDLTALTATASGDYLPIADISEGAAASKNKRVTVQSLFQGIPVNVGIGTAAPSASLDVVSASTGVAEFNGPANATVSFTGTSFAEGKIQCGGEFTIGSTNNFPIAFVTNNTERLRIDSSGRVGIGTSSPAEKLQVDGNIALDNSVFDTPKYIHFRANAVDAEYGGIKWYNFQWNNTIRASVTSGPDVSVANGYLAFSTGISGLDATEKMRIDASGRLLVGTSSASGGYLNNNSLVHVQAEGASAGITIHRPTSFSALAAPYLVFSRSRGTPAVIVQSGDNLGSIEWGGADGTDVESTAALIRAEVDGTPGANDMPGRLVFATTADGASSPTERMRIGSNGLFTMGGLYVFTTAGAANVNVDSSGVVQRSTSSIKYKTDIETLENSYSEALLECRPVWYRSTCKLDNPTWGWWGFIAEEVAQIDPRLVHWKTTEFSQDDQGATVSVPCEPEPEGVAYDRFVPYLLNLIKQQKEQAAAMQARIETLEAAVAALQGA